MKKFFLINSILTLFILHSFSQPASFINKLRAPAYPLITIDPYTSAWSFSNNLYDDAVRHWTGTKHSLIGAIRVDGKVFRFMGTEETPLKPIVPTAAIQKWTGHYTFEKPSEGWESLKFDDSNWKQGQGAFGTQDQPNLGTSWDTQDIWVRREFSINEDLSTQNLILEYSHDDIFELYINGIQIVKTGYDWKNNILLPLSEKIKQYLHKGKNVIAAHCHNQEGGGYVDFGLYNKISPKKYFSQTAVQRFVNVMPTQTYYQFDCGAVRLDLTF
ncbi:MAG: DUF4964 domain-containing protein, partial [Bacteroidota bacterium]|nr:DUF4964 domain-containing protein [Bacteroidota bacterium]